MNKPARKNLLAFTLAEVLITLAIIGVVSALTIPTVKNNFLTDQHQMAFLMIGTAIRKMC